MVIGRRSDIVPVTEWGTSGVLWDPVMSKLSSQTSGLGPHLLLQAANMEQNIKRTGAHHDHLKRVYEMSLFPPPSMSLLTQEKYNENPRERSRDCEKGTHSRSQLLSRSRTSPLEFLWLASAGNGRGSI